MRGSSQNSRSATDSILYGSHKRIHQGKKKPYFWRRKQLELKNTIDNLKVWCQDDWVGDNLWAARASLSDIPESWIHKDSMNRERLQRNADTLSRPNDTMEIMDMIDEGIDHDLLQAIEISEARPDYVLNDGLPWAIAEIESISLDKMSNNTYTYGLQIVEGLVSKTAQARKAGQWFIYDKPGYRDLIYIVDNKPAGAVFVAGLAVLADSIS